MPLTLDLERDRLKTLSELPVENDLALEWWPLWSILQALDALDFGILWWGSYVGNKRQPQMVDRPLWVALAGLSLISRGRLSIGMLWTGWAES